MYCSNEATILASIYLLNILSNNYTFTSTILEFIWLVIDGLSLMKENGLASLSQKRRSPSPNTEAPQKIWIFPAPSYKTRKKISASEKKIICVYGGVYTIENKDTNTYYQKFVRVRDQTWEIVEIVEVFKSYLKKITPT